MTTKFIETQGIELTKINGESYCKMIDVLKLIHHEYFETEDKETQKAPACNFHCFFHAFIFSYIFFILLEVHLLL